MEAKTDERENEKYDGTNESLSPMMSENVITIKENWKAPFRADYHYLKTWFWIFEIISVIIGVVCLIYQVFFSGHPFIKALGTGGFILGASILFVPIIILASSILLLPFLLLVILPKILKPKVYVFSVKDERFIIHRNNHEFLSIPQKDVIKCTFIVVQVNWGEGNPLGNELKISFYDNKGREKNKVIKLNYIPDADKLLLRNFLYTNIINS